MKKIMLMLGIMVFISTLMFAQSIIYIPADYPTIQAGLNAANAGTTVIVSARTWYENIEWPDTDGIVLISEDGAGSTIIDGNSLDRVIRIPQYYTLTNATVIDGFTIQNGYCGTGPNPGGGIADFCGITIRNNIIKNNFADGVGGGIHLTDGNPLVFNNLIINNTSTDVGGGIFLRCGAEIRNNTIVGNTATGTGGGAIGIFFATGSPIIEDNIIVKNYADGSMYGGGGIYVFYSFGYSLDYNDVWENTPDNYSGCSAGPNSISADPVFVSSYNGSNFIDQSTSPCINAGSQTAIDARLNEYTTSFEAVLDSDQVDLGFHYNPHYFVYSPVATAATTDGTLTFFANWNASTGATGYYLDVATDVDFTTFLSGYENLDVLNILTYSVTASSAIDHYYRLRAYNANGTSSNSNVIIVSGSTLPVELAAFTAIYNTVSDFVSLFWATASETDVNGFNIYRNTEDSFVEADKINIDLIEGSGTTTVNSEYSFVDETADPYYTTYYYWLEVINFGGTSDVHGSFKYIPIDVNHDGELGIITSALSPCYPNPSRIGNEIKFNFRVGGLEGTARNVELKVYNILGKLVAEVVSGERLVNDYTETWKPEDLSNGVYFYQLKTDNYSEVKKMMIQ